MCHEFMFNVPRRMQVVHEVAPKYVPVVARAILATYIVPGTAAIRRR